MGRFRGGEGGEGEGRHVQDRGESVLTLNNGDTYLFLPTSPLDGIVDRFAMS